MFKVWHLTSYSGISLVRSTWDQDFFYGLNVVRTKRCNCVCIFFVAYADLYDWFDTVLQYPLFGAWFRGYFQMYTAPSHKYSIADIFDGF